MRYGLLIFLMVFSASVYAQPSDFVVLKKRGKTVRSFYAGTNIQFVTNTGAYRDALINRVYNDTLYIQEFLVMQIPTTFGTYINDTSGSFRYKYHYNQIASLGRPKAKFNMSGSGASLMGGGVLLVAGSGIVYLADREKFSPELMGAGAVLGGLGYMMSKAASKPITPGKNGYRIEYMDMTP